MVLRSQSIKEEELAGKGTNKLTLIESVVYRVLETLLDNQVMPLKMNFADLESGAHM